MSFLLYVATILYVQFVASALLVSRFIARAIPWLRVTMADFTRSTAGFLGIRTTIKHGQLYTAGPVFLFFNHRSWTDFFLDQVVCEQHAHVSTLSRMFVYWGIPFASSFLNLDKNLLFFRRGASSQDEMNAVIDRHFADVPLSCMIVYPEGTRNPGLVEMPLKTGMMRVAFRKRIPVQIVMTSNKEKAMREKPSYSAQYGVECETVYGDLVRPDAFADADAFIAECNAAWRRAAAVLNTPTTPAECAAHRKVDLWPAARHMNAKAALVAALLVVLAAALWMRPLLMCTLWSAWVGGYFIKIYRESFGPRLASLSASASPAAGSASAKSALGGSSAAAADAAGSSPSTAPKRKSARAD